MKTLALLAVAATVVACDATPTAPVSRLTPTAINAAVVENDRFEVVFVTVNNCDGTPVALQLTVHNVFSITPDAAGGLHLKFHQNAEGQGTAATGTKYVLNDALNEQLTLQAGEEETITFHRNLISQGGAPNAILFETFHFTITPNGDVTSFHDNFRIECNGTA